MAQRSIERENPVDEEIASLLEALRARPEPAAPSDETEAELAQPHSGAAVEPTETADVEAQSVPVRLEGRATLLPYAAARLSTVERRERPSRVRRFARRIRKHRGVLAFYLLGLAVAFVVGWLIPTLGNS